MSDPKPKKTWRPNVAAWVTGAVLLAVGLYEALSDPTVNRSGHWAGVVVTALIALALMIGSFRAWRRKWHIVAKDEEEAE